MIVFGCPHLNSFPFGGNSLPDKELKQPFRGALPFLASLAAAAQIYALLVRPLGQIFTWKLMRQERRDRGQWES